MDTFEKSNAADPHRDHRWLIADLLGAKQVLPKAACQRVDLVCLYAKSVTLPPLSKKNPAGTIEIQFYDVESLLKDLLSMQCLVGDTVIERKGGSDIPISTWRFSACEIERIDPPRLDYESNEISMIKVVMSYQSLSVE
jgi:hypothetical protein